MIQRLTRYVEIAYPTDLVETKIINRRVWREHKTAKRYVINAVPYVWKTNVGVVIVGDGLSVPKKLVLMHGGSSSRRPLRI